MGEKAFRCWGPEAWNRVCQKVSKRKPKLEEGGAEPRGSKRKGRAPSDADETERRGYYAFLEAKYKEEQAKQAAAASSSLESDIRARMEAEMEQMRKVHLTQPPHTRAYARIISAI